jgi:hypothetical protein
MINKMINQSQNGKSLIKKQFFIWLAFLLLANLANAQVNAGNFKITENDKINSDAFKAKVGTARLLEFKKLESLIIPKSTAAVVAPEGEHFIGQYSMTETELVFLLGTPDVKVSNVIYQYNLGNSNSACKLYVGIDSEGFVSYSVLKSCN